MRNPDTEFKTPDSKLSTPDRHMYYIVYGLLYLMSLLPMPVLYLFSDFAYILLYYIIGYRKKVIMDNLMIAFPQKNHDERKQIARAFYKNFVDNFIETIKLFSAGKQFLQKHYAIENPEMYEQFREQGRKCQLHLGHNFNWELANIAMPFFTLYAFIVVYMPIKNKIFDRLFIRLRSGTGSVLLPATQMSRAIISYRNTLYMLALVADQAPGSPSNAYWLHFFGRPTPFVRGPERGARIGNIPVLFGYFHKIKRGHYRARLELGSDNPALLPEGELTRRYIDFLERCIAEQPALYLWSHRRWKYAWKDEYAKFWIGKEAKPATS